MGDVKLREAVITSEVCASPETLHAYLQEALDFPAYYGRNFSALADCLAEACTPLLITFAIREQDLPTEMQASVLKLAQVCAREAIANENVSLIVEHV